MDKSGAKISILWLSEQANFNGYDVTHITVRLLVYSLILA